RAAPRGAVGGSRARAHNIGPLRVQPSGRNFEQPLGLAPYAHLTAGSPPPPALLLTHPQAHPVEHAPAAAAAGVRMREILGVPMAMTDYERTMDVMDALVAQRERGYVCCS